MCLNGYFWKRSCTVCIAGLLQVQQTFDAQRAIYVDFWIFLLFCCLHCIYARGLVNLQVLCFIFGKTTVGWGKWDLIRLITMNFFFISVRYRYLWLYKAKKCNRIFSLCFQMRATIQQIQNVIYQCLSTHEKLEASLRDLSRTGDVQACKSARKIADSLLKEQSKELKPLLSFLQSSPVAAHILPKVCLFSFHLLSPISDEEFIASNWTSCNWFLGSTIMHELNCHMKTGMIPHYPSLSCILIMHARICVINL